MLRVLRKLTLLRDGLDQIRMNEIEIEEEQDQDVNLKEVQEHNSDGGKEILQASLKLNDQKDSDENESKHVGKGLPRRKSGILKLKHKAHKNPKLSQLASISSKRKNKTLRGLNNEKSLRSLKYSSTRSGLKESSSVKKKELSEQYPFKGKWESTEAGLDTFMNELNLSKKFTKLAVAFGGDVTNKLKIKQFGTFGDHFIITENNERRKIKYVVNVGEDFTSFDENEEELECTSRWGKSEKILIIEELNKRTKELTIITREVKIKEGILIETRKVDENKPTTRKYERY